MTNTLQLPILPTHTYDKDTCFVCTQSLIADRWEVDIRISPILINYVVLCTRCYKDAAEIGIFD